MARYVAHRYGKLADENHLETRKFITMRMAEQSNELLSTTIALLATMTTCSLFLFLD